MRGKLTGAQSITHTIGEHPRVCGENALGVAGKLGAGRNIPAYAGKTLSLLDQLHHGFGTSPRMRGKPIIGLWRWNHGVEHPRVCGENIWAAPASWIEPGTSPRMRGKLSANPCSAS